MKPEELKKLMIGALDDNSDPQAASRKLEDEGLSFDFSNAFSDKLIERIFSTSATVVREMEYVRSMRFIFNRVALTGVAAIILLLISIFLAEGSLSLNSFLGISDTYDGSIVSMLTGN